MRIALAQLNPIVGDLAGNRRLVEEAAAKAASERADLLIAPEMVLTGYPPMDLLERDGFVRDQLRELDALAASSHEVAIALGAVLPVPAAPGGTFHNACVLLAGGRQVAARAKTHLPTYDVFDERRYFAPADRREPVPFGDGETVLGLTVCEDAWVEPQGYVVDPVGELARAGANLVLNPSCSPWHAGKARERRGMIARLAARHRVPIAFVNQVGGNDELVFDGGSFVADASGRVHSVLPLFDAAFAVVDLPFPEPGMPSDDVPELDRTAQLEVGLVLGIRDYFGKQGLPRGAVVGLSGGIDSAVTAHLAVEALGPEAVLGVAMPSPFSSSHSIEDALALGQNLGIETRVVAIEPIFSAYLDVFRALFGARDDYGLAQQNIQSRIRGAILMAVSNAENRLVLATGNKSELSVGYCTLYGDTVGGLAVLGDVYKRDVYAIARRANAIAGGERIPARSIEKPPSAELKPDQLDSDDLPDYPVLDAILEQAIEGGLGAAAIAPPRGADRKLVEQVVARLDRNEYKRRQTPLVLRTSTKAFGTGRRLPIVHRYQ
jgi:NAD+ synthase (glutamine-hydrolysing)